LCYKLKMVEIVYCFFFSSRRRHTRFSRDWSSDVCSSDLPGFLRPTVGRLRVCNAYFGRRPTDHRVSWAAGAGFQNVAVVLAGVLHHMATDGERRRLPAFVAVDERPTVGRFRARASHNGTLRGFFAPLWDACVCAMRISAAGRPTIAFRGRPALVSKM